MENEIQKILAPQDSLSQSQFLKLLTSRKDVKQLKYFESKIHFGRKVPINYYKPISLITIYKE